MRLKYYEYLSLFDNYNEKHARGKFLDTVNAVLESVICRRQDFDNSVI